MISASLAKPALAVFAVVLSIFALVGWFYPAGEPMTAQVSDEPATGSTPLSFPMVPNTEEGRPARTGNGLFGLGARGELVFDARSVEQLEGLARTLPLDLTDLELTAIDEFAAAGLSEPSASEARRIVRDFLARRGIGLAQLQPQPAAVPETVPEQMPASLLALRPPQPEGDGVVRFPGMGDE